MTSPTPGRQAAGCASGLGCGVVVLIVAAAPLALVWLVLRWAGVHLPSLVTVLHGPPAGTGWLALSTIAALAVLVVGAGLVAWMFLSDSVPEPLPRRVYLVWLIPALPVLDLVSIVVAWICRALGHPDAARLLGTGPWLAGAALATVAAVVYSGLVANDR
ncbi:hypothetical protein ACWT_2021 [Actinoplanes sp. SE50]|uniref:hypothetical protein n=1 Tax=unclassified Actinoplanes TaxID=2626549 RepID=UPI00023EC416|nr:MULTISPECIES: hypothetical protein [unclassified Actinoplanes]AEV83040.1 hypothetical protein ACPL_2143 [Actinoplanes sp. SE50/110]ATO81436.1 hypothetical protein ACWT_2021 [Actinoplanes sp. SE50]SLL98843.1 hypothetical protein ACSP50_2070 [Actinoplanes sp. SE50/110]